MAKQQTAQAQTSTTSTIGAILSAQAVAVQQQMDTLLTRGRERHDEIVREDEEREAKGGVEPIRELPPWVLTDEEEHAIDTLQARTKRLQQVQQLLSDDPELLHVVDASIRNRVSATARRQSMLSVVVAIVSLVAGWLLSAISPLSAAHLLAR